MNYDLSSELKSNAQIKSQSEINNSVRLDYTQSLISEFNNEIILVFKIFDGTKFIFDINNTFIFSEKYKTCKFKSLKNVDSGNENIFLMGEIGIIEFNCENKLILGDDFDGYYEFNFLNNKKESGNIFLKIQ